MEKLIIRVSPEAVEKLKGLSDQFKKTQSEVVEFLILDRASVSDQHQNYLRRESSWSAYAESRIIPPKPGVKNAFIAGYNRGWSNFQIRHKENSFIIPAPERAQIAEKESEMGKNIIMKIVCPDDALMVDVESLEDHLNDYLLREYHLDGAVIIVSQEDLCEDEKGGGDAEIG